MEEIQIEKNRFIWPVRGSVKTSFGIQPNKTYHNWIKIVSPMGTKVKAAASGTVIFSSQLKNYGETVIIRHKDNFATVYTHLKKRYVKTDQNVKKGDLIAVVGEIDDTSNVYINFEIRLQGKARNPLFFLP
jgi:lipoprotein NlpD